MNPPPEADAGTRTPDPFITSEVLYQLSYVGAVWDASAEVPGGTCTESLPPRPAARTARADDLHSQLAHGLHQ